MSSVELVILQHAYTCPLDQSQEYVERNLLGSKVCVGEESLDRGGGNIVVFQAGLQEKVLFFFPLKCVAVVEAC